MESHCKNCQWWSKYSHNDCGECKHPKLYQNTDAELPPDGAQAYHYGSISTGPEFGCVHFQPTEEAADRSAFARAGVKL